MFSKKIKILKFILATSFFLFAFSNFAVAQSDTSAFFIEKEFDVLNRTKVDAVFVKSAPGLYFYVEKSWWEAQSQAKKNDILKSLDELSVEFKNNIYPNLTSIFGFERRPGIDKDDNMTVLFHPVKGDEVGYFRTDDGYEKLQVSTSNEREMIYISVNLLDDPKLKLAVAHEFTHLITFNQKNVNFNVEDDTWLNEARADFSSAILKYDNQPDIANLQSRIRDFIESPSDSVTEWRGLKYDYASASLFTHYLVDHYGVKILSDSLKSKYTGIESINYALEKNGYKERFSDIFSDWNVALVLNDCSYGLNYCYSNDALKNFKIAPNINFLPISGDVSLSVISSIKNWAGTWQKFIGGAGDLELDFYSYGEPKFSVPYVIGDKDGKYYINKMLLDSNGKGDIKIKNFGTDYKSLIIIPSLQEKTSDFIGVDIAKPFNYSVNIGSTKNDSDPLMQHLLDQIESLKKQIAELQAKIGNGNAPYCASINSNLYAGISNMAEVKCLQGFLKGQGGAIYPEGLVTGFFGSLTKAAVIRFQAKYGVPQTGYVGPMTRGKINQILSGG